MGYAGCLHLGRMGVDSTVNEAVALGSDLWIFLVVTLYSGLPGSGRKPEQHPHPRFAIMK